MPSRAAVARALFWRDFGETVLLECEETADAAVAPATTAGSR